MRCSASPTAIAACVLAVAAAITVIVFSVSRALENPCDRCRPADADDLVVHVPTPPAT